MNGVHDMGGQHGLGPIEYEKNEPVFHSEWEGRVYAMTRSLRALRKWNADTHRFGIERLPAADYLRMSYYERWFHRMVAQVVEYGLVTPDELSRGTAAPGSPKATPALTLASVPGFLNRGIPSSVDPAVKPRFRVDQRVRAKNIHPVGHTRLPRYARGRTGVIVRDHGVHTFPDTNALNQGQKRQHLYVVRFAARELWGPEASARDSVHLDLFEDYLERV